MTWHCLCQQRPRYLARRRASVTPPDARRRDEHPRRRLTSNDSSAVGQRRGSKGSSEETEDENSLNVLAHSVSDLTEGESQHGADEDGSPAVDLGDGRPEDRT